MYLDQLQAVQARHERAGGHRLGTLLWWSLSNNRIKHDALVELADRHRASTGVPALAREALRRVSAGLQTHGVRSHSGGSFFDALRNRRTSS